MPIKNAFVHLVACTLFLLSGLVGIFAAFGLCTAFWGPQVMGPVPAHPPPAGSLPPLWCLLLIMVPAMVVGFVGGIFVFVVPLYAYFDLRIFNTGPNDQRLCALYIRLLQRVYARSWPDAPSPALDPPPGRPAR